MPVTVISYIKLLVLPPSSLLLAALIGVVWYERRWGLPLSALSLCSLLVLSLPAVVSVWAKQWERFPAVHLAEIQSFKPQVLVVLGGGVEKGASESSSPIRLHARTLVRLRYAARLAKQFRVPVLVSGGQAVAGVAISEAELMATALEKEFQVPVVWQERRSRNTAENARFSRELLKDDGKSKIILVTHAYHMPRAASEFVKAGFEVLPAPTAFIGHELALSIFDFLPSAMSLMHSFLLSHECLGMVWYAIRY